MEPAKQQGDKPPFVFFILLALVMVLWLGGLVLNTLWNTEVVSSSDLEPSMSSADAPALPNVDSSSSTTYEMHPLPGLPAGISAVVIELDDRTMGELHVLAAIGAIPGHEEDPVKHSVGLALVMLPPEINLDAGIAFFQKAGLGPKEILRGLVFLANAVEEKGMVDLAELIDRRIICFQAESAQTAPEQDEPAYIPEAPTQYF